MSGEVGYSLVSQGVAQRWEMQLSNIEVELDGIGYDLYSLVMSNTV